MVTEMDRNGRLRERINDSLMELMLLPKSNRASMEQLLIEIRVEQMKRLEDELLLLPESYKAWM